MTNLEALTLPGCQPSPGYHGWYFPCGLVIDPPHAGQPAKPSRPTDETPVEVVLLPMVTVAHRRHHEEEHNELDEWRLVEVFDPEDEVMEMWCECLKLDTHWHWGPPIFMVPRRMEDA